MSFQKVNSFVNTTILEILRLKKLTVLQKDEKEQTILFTNTNQTHSQRQPTTCVEIKLKVPEQKNKKCCIQDYVEIELIFRSDVLSLDVQIQSSMVIYSNFKSSHMYQPEIFFNKILPQLVKIYITNYLFNIRRICVFRSPFRHSLWLVTHSPVHFCKNINLIKLFGELLMTVLIRA